MDDPPIRKRNKEEPLTLRKALQKIEGLILTIRRLKLTIKELQQKCAEQEKQNEELQQRVDDDFLTGLLNRRGFYRRAVPEILNLKRIAEKSKTIIKVVFLMLDADHFKAINDEHGHHVGDMVLKKLAYYLRKNSFRLRKSDLVARMGGEEFLVMLPLTEPEQILARICDPSVGYHRLPAFPVNLEHGTLTVTLSGGIVVYEVTSEKLNEDEIKQQVDEILRKADRALYDAKRNGRHRIEVYRDE